MAVPLACRRTSPGCHYSSPDSSAMQVILGERGGFHAPRSPPKASRGLADGRLQRLRLVGALPAERGQLAAEVPVAGGLAVDRPAQIERLDDALGRELEVLA